MHIAVFFNNISINNVNCKSVKNGNPGIGGTEFCILSFCELFKEYYPNNKVSLIVTSEGQLPLVDNIVCVKSLDDVPKTVKEMKADVLLISSVYNSDPLPEKFFVEADESNISVVTWGHNYYLNDYCNILVKHNCVKANVFVGRQQYDRYIDHPIIKKSTFIFNMYPIDKNKSFIRENDSKTVTYIGSLVYHKGFHILAKQWKTILDSVPDAQLLIIGSGKLYDRNTKLGKYGIADEKYENLFMPYLIDDNGEILNSVKFLGVLGAEKQDIILKTSVGIVNPSGRTETFGISALDFESLGVPVVTIAKGGFLDTVLNEKTGLLYRRNNKLASLVIELLNNKTKNEILGKNGIELAKEFDSVYIMKCWYDLMNKVINEERLDIEMPVNYFSSQLKWIRIVNRKIKNLFKIEKLPSIIFWETLVRNLIRKLKE